MLRKRIIPILSIQNDSLVKTINFKKINYIGDPCNTVRIFNELEVDELVICDIRASLDKSEPNFKLLQDISSECFMPLVYGGGIKSLDQAKKIFDLGFEKIIINSFSFTDHNILSNIASSYGSQALICSIDVKKNFFGKKLVYSHSGTHNTNHTPLFWAKEVEKRGAGEILLTSIDREGTWKGFDFDLSSYIAKNTSIPVIGHGGASSINDINEILSKTDLSGVALGSMVLYQKKGMGVLINFPNKRLLSQY